MSERDWLAEQFEEHRPHLRAVAYRMLGSLAEADDAVQEAWLRLSRTDAGEVQNLGGWLTTVVSRVCLDMLRSRKSRREDSMDAPNAFQPAPHADAADPEQEAVLADAVGLAMLVVLERLEPAERLAFVLHDMFGVPFDEIAPIVGRNVAATRQLASRARRRVRGEGARGDHGRQNGGPDRQRQRAVIDAFLAAARGGDFAGLLAVLDPNVVFRADGAGLPPEVHGAEAVAPWAMRGRAQAARPLLVNGAVGVVVAPGGRLLMVLEFTVREGRIVGIEAVSAAERVGGMELAMLEG